jgi:SPP1 gp7 family putative phage head morphogenesis protein
MVIPSYNCTCPLSINVRKKNLFDPSKTLGLQNRLVVDLKRRFAKINREIYRAVVTNNVFGYLTVNASYPNQFNFPTSQQKVEAFMKWLKSRINATMLEVVYMNQLGSAVNEAWLNMYIYDSYKRGVLRARYELEEAGMISPLDEASKLSIAATPFHMDRVGLIYLRAFNELKGITDAMDTQISRVLAQGMIDGDGPRVIAKKILATVNGGGGDLAITDTLGRFIPAKRRAIIMARTEVIRAHHSAMVQEYRNWGVAGVEVQAELVTAGDARVCLRCSELQGKVYTLDQAEGLIPVHPQCRCVVLPKVVENKNKTIP